MTRSKIIHVTLAAFCGLAFQLQASAANAQSQPNSATTQSQARTAPKQSISIMPGQHLTPRMGVRSPNGHSLVLQQDGNLVLFNSKRVPIWSTNTKGYEPVQLIMKPDGNLVLYSTNGQVWASNTSGNPGAFLALHDDGNLAIHRSGSQPDTSTPPLWASGTSGR
jgi:glucose/arabinose dehydrogenase